ncbi:MAG TPA: pyridoxamine 5'-phosphate oxidase family protein [Candidatus Binatia bacterium]|jgi:nitroimidazol reductase NimA-like FMN-containing flavoprotein (pyridoxamine 5'-phosphate oxidase superfamily)
MATTSMTRAEREAFLAGVHVGVLALAEEGRPPLTLPIWYDYRPGGELRLITGRDSRKGRLLTPGARLSLCAQSEVPPYKYVTVEGVVERLGDADVARDVRPIARRYLGQEGGDGYVAWVESAHPDQDDVLVTVRIERWMTMDFSKEF